LLFFLRQRPCFSSTRHYRFKKSSPGPNTYLHTYLLTYILTYLLTPWRRVLLKKLTGLQLVKKFPAFHGTRRFITALTNVRHLSLSWASPIQSIYPHPTCCRSILILSTHLRLGLPIGLLPSGFPTLRILKNKIPARCHLLFYCTSYRLNMFRALLCPSSGLRDYDIDYHIDRFVPGLL